MHFLHINKIIKNIKNQNDYVQIVLKILLFSLFMGLVYYMYLLFYFPIQPNISSKFNIILSNDYKGYLDEKEYLKKIQDIYKIKEYDID
ncbi:MAG: hypothetical protein N2169_06735, partial [bacterium]|nr:hypothetical protein [bacterium]